MSDIASTSLLSPESRFSFVHIFAPEEGKMTKKGAPKYTLTVLIPKSANIDMLRAAAEAAARAEWGANMPKKLKSPFIDGDQTEREEQAGHWVLRLSTTNKPGVVDANVQSIIDPSEVYSGCWGFVSLHAFTWTDDQGGKGVSFGLNNVQKTRDDEPLSGRSKPEQDFQPLAGAGEGAGSAESLFG